MTSPADSATRAVRAAIESDTQHGAVVPPLHLSSNFTFAGLGKKRPYDYTRSGNPTRDALGEALAELEGGAGAVVTSSGMAARSGRVAGRMVDGMGASARVTAGWGHHRHKKTTPWGWFLRRAYSPR